LLTFFALSWLMPSLTVAVRRYSLPTAAAPGLERLERDLALDQLLLEDVEQRGAALLELALTTIDSPDQAISAPCP
jgi:hypothetical protein